jgi:hypothetical protein
METYNIQIQDKDYKVTVQDDITYLIQNNEIKDFVLCPIINQTGTTWKVIKGMALVDLVNALGLAIDYKEKLSRTKKD